jgi:hypothetical protein
VTELTSRMLAAASVDTALEGSVHPAPPRDLYELLDDHTRALVEKRRAGKVHARGWVRRRALAAADMLGILIAFSLPQLAFAGRDVGVDRVSTGAEIVLFALTLPLWVVLGRLYGLYSADEERADNSTWNDVFGVFNMLTVGAWLMFAVAYAETASGASFRCGYPRLKESDKSGAARLSAPTTIEGLK